MWQYNVTDELYHHGVLGMKWGKRKAKSSSGLTTRQKKRISKINAKALKSGRLIDDGNPKVIGVRQKNGDILFVDKKDVNKLGVDGAESKTLKYIQTERAKASKKVIEKNANKTVSQAKVDRDKYVQSMFKKHKQLYEDFGGPDMVDDDDFFDLVVSVYNGDYDDK